MKKQLLLFILFGIFTTAYSVEKFSDVTQSIVDTWVWEKSIGGEKNPYTATPKTIGFTKKIEFTAEGKIITYKDNVEIRNSTYEISKGIGVNDNLEHDLISFEGKTYVIENLDNQNLTIVSNDAEGTRVIYKK